MAESLRKANLFVMDISVSKPHFVQPISERNPTVQELVNTEDDRLALLEHRLRRLKNSLKRRKAELEKFLEMNGKSN